MTAPLEGELLPAPNGHVGAMAAWQPTDMAGYTHTREVVHRAVESYQPTSAPASRPAPTTATPMARAADGAWQVVRIAGCLLVLVLAVAVLVPLLHLIAALA